MRIGINIPWRGEQGRVLAAPEVAAQAALIEQSGLDGIWVGDHLRASRPDPLMYLLVSAVATSRVELGTCIYIVPLRNTYDVAQRFYTLQSLAPRRVTFGVGAGSSAREYEMSGKDFGERFGLLRDAMVTIRAICSGEDATFQATAPELTLPWGAEVGAPRFVLGAWDSDSQIRRAATEYDGWISSGGGAHVGGWRHMGDQIARFREYGGQRVLMSTVSVDLSVPTTEIAEDAPFYLQCQPDAATERLTHLESLGFDDVILHAGFAHTFTLDELEQIRSLMPRDERVLVPKTAGTRVVGE